MEVKPRFERTEVGVVPSGWHSKRIAELGEVRGRVGWKGYTKKDLVAFGPLTIGAKHIDSECRLDLSDPTYLSQEKFLESPEIKIELDDILIVQRGTIGKLVLMDSDIGDATINPSMVIVRLRKALPKYARYFLLSSAGQRQILSDTSSTGVPMISQRQIENFSIMLPKLEAEQRAIAEALSDVDGLLGGLDRLIAKKRDLKQAAMQQLLTGQTRLPGFHGEWEVMQLGEVATFLKGKGLPKSALIPDGADPCIHYGELFTRYPETISEIFSRTNGSRDAFCSIANDVLMPTSDVTPRGLAKASCVTVDGVILGGDILVIRSDTRRVFGSFLSYIIRREEDQVLRLVTGSTVYHLYGSDMKKFTLALPTVPEQTAIAEVLTEMDLELAGLEQRREKTRALKQAMMQELLTGRTRLV